MVVMMMEWVVVMVVRIMMMMEWMMVMEWMMMMMWMVMMVLREAESKPITFKACVTKPRLSCIFKI